MKYIDNIFTTFANDPSQVNWIINNEYSLAFYDKFPENKIHVLVIPKNKYTDMIDFLNNSTPEEQLDLNKTIQEVISKLKLDEYGFNIKINTFKSHNQQIFHYHVHIVSKGSE